MWENFWINNNFNYFKTMTRTELTKKRNAIKKQVELLEKQFAELTKMDLLLCDNKSWYREQMETVGRGKSKQEFLIGRVYWKEIFTDEGDGTKIKIERSQAVKRDGKWIVNLGF